MVVIAQGYTSNYYRPGSLMGGLFENTAYFRIGDERRQNGREKECYKVVVKGGAWDFEDYFSTGRQERRFPAEYAFRVINVCVKM